MLAHVLLRLPIAALLGVQVVVYGVAVVSMRYLLWRVRRIPQEWRP